MTSLQHGNRLLTQPAAYRRVSLETDCSCGASKPLRCCYNVPTHGASLLHRDHILLPLPRPASRLCFMCTEHSNIKDKITKRKCTLLMVLYLASKQSAVCTDNGHLAAIDEAKQSHASSKTHSSPGVLFLYVNEASRTIPPHQEHQMSAMSSRLIQKHNKDKAAASSCFLCALLAASGAECSCAHGILLADTRNGSPKAGLWKTFT